MERWNLIRAEKTADSSFRPPIPPAPSTSPHRQLSRCEPSCSDGQKFLPQGQRTLTGSFAEGPAELGWEKRLLRPSPYLPHVI
ncbi:hypothetical protein CLOP_g17227 [Closterium sp. NIES-67]|nr:hypothetical protein CLOP_g17227 [Closterium sp. NIES-67]